ncbi:hypothetical protein R3X28_16260 [Maribacter sp. TH_r10]|uniref:hypothetical protein n=1 Tax=Maribacter sp. TH_r10 TaxID=3082086 RepID=UPI002954BAA5|nr:hypothetical protein [Maribacter sp. TH_r10]MDV7140447.1 hypothetical protein [Maribacter sp. TH_r10]
MNIPNLPTDNLYKFLALTGLFLMVASFGYKEYRNHEYNIQKTEIKVEEKILEFKIENKKTMVEHSRKLRDFEVDILKPKNGDKSIEDLQKQIEKFINSYKIEIEEAELDWYYNDAGKLLMNSELAEVYKKRTDKLNWILNLSMLIGFFSMISGFYFWYIKLQRHQDLILLNEYKISELKINQAKNK